MAGAAVTTPTPDTPSPKLDPNCQCVCHTQPGVMHVVSCCQAPDAGELVTEEQAAMALLLSKTVRDPVLTRALRTIIALYEALAAAEARADAAEANLQDIDALLMEGQGDDDGQQIMPDFGDDDSIEAKVEACLHLLEKRRDAMDGMLTEIADLRARADAAEARVAVRVKPLVWEERSDIPGLHNAESPIGWWYNVHALGDGRFKYDGDPCSKAVPRAFPTLEAAQTAAQADYEARIRAALETGAGDE